MSLALRDAAIRWAASLPLLCCAGFSAARAEAPAPSSPIPSSPIPSSSLSAGPVTLKLDVRIDGGVIKVGDLWDGAGAQKDVVIGPAPSPGRAIVIPAAQLAYIARLYGVDWRPTSGVERTALERLGRTLTREELAAPVRRGLAGAGADASAAVEFADFAPVEVPLSAFPVISLDGLSYDQEGGRFSADLSASGEGMQTLRFRVTGQATRMVAAVVAARRLQPGDVIGAADVRVAQIPGRRLAGQAVGDVSLVVGQSARRAIVAGQPLSASDVGPAVLVAKGDPVMVVLDAPGIHLAAQSVSLGAGGRGDLIQVMNPISHAVVAARVTGPGQAAAAAANGVLGASAPPPPPTPASFSEVSN